MKNIPTVEKVARVRPAVLATRRMDYWVVVYDAQGHAAWVCLDKGTWVEGAPAPAGLVDQVKAWLRANWDKVSLYELNFHHEERYEPDLRYGNRERLGEIVAA